MNKWIIVTGLLVLNLLLGAAVYERFGARTANAQIGQAKSDVASVAGFTNNQTIFYLLDVSSGKLAALRLDVNNKRIVPVTTRDVAADLKAVR